MDEAIIVLSRKGWCKATIKGRDVRSREHARKLWPLVAPHTRQLVTWVRPSFKDKTLQRRSHFRVLIGKRTYDPRILFAHEEAARIESLKESAEHAAAKYLIAAELRQCIDQKRAMPWAFKDAAISDFPVEGDLLLGANAIELERNVSTPFHCSFRLDVAVIGKSAQNRPMVFGGIEIENTHAFDGRKALLGKSIGFPLISVDISGMAFTEITPEWARNVLSDTTRSNARGRRWTYVYVHDLLYPLFTSVPDFIDPDRRRQYLVFADNETLEQLRSWTKLLGVRLQYDERELAVALINAKSEQALKMLITAGEIVGEGWRQMNQQRCLRITVPRSDRHGDIRAFRLHLCLARLLISYANALVGYQYCNSISNDDPGEEIWIHRRWNVDLKHYDLYRVLPKRLAEPMSSILKAIESVHAS